MVPDQRNGGVRARLGRRPPDPFLAYPRGVRGGSGFPPRRRRAVHAVEVAPRGRRRPARAVPRPAVAPVRARADGGALRVPRGLLLLLRPGGAAPLPGRGDRGGVYAPLGPG